MLSFLKQRGIAKRELIAAQAKTAIASRKRCHSFLLIIYCSCSSLHLDCTRCPRRAL